MVPNGGVADSLDEAKAAFRAAWDPACRADREVVKRCPVRADFADNETNGRITMKLKTFALRATTALATAFVGAAAVGQPTTGTVESHLAMAKVAADDDNQRLYRALCEQPAAGPNTGGPRSDPERSTWHVEPMKSLLRRREGIFRLGGEHI